MPQYPHSPNGLNMPHLGKVDEYDYWAVRRGGQWVEVTSEEVARQDAEYYEREGYTDVVIEKRHQVVIGETRPW